LIHAGHAGSEALEAPRSTGLDTRVMCTVIRAAKSEGHVRGTGREQEPGARRDSWPGDRDFLGEELPQNDAEAPDVALHRQWTARMEGGI